MVWSIRCNFPAIRSYADAVFAWEEAVIFPRDREGPRGLVDKRKKHMTIQRTAANDIVLRLYEHPVVTWHLDNSVTIKGWDTISMVVFARHCTPAEMSARLCGGRFAIDIGGRTYRADNVTFRQRDNTWKADEITSPWVRPVVNRERAKQALDETNYKEFRSWLVVYLQMISPSRELYPVWTSEDTIVSMVRDRKWRELVTRFPHESADQVLSKIRRAIYQQYGCIEHKSVPFLG